MNIFDGSNGENYKKSGSNFECQIYDKPYHLATSCFVPRDVIKGKNHDSNFFGATTMNATSHDASLYLVANVVST